MPRTKKQWKKSRKSKKTDDSKNMATPTSKSFAQLAIEQQPSKDDLKSVQVALQTLFRDLAASDHPVPADVFFESFYDLLPPQVASSFDEPDWFTQALKLTEAEAYKSWIKNPNLDRAARGGVKVLRSARGGVKALRSEGSISTNTSADPTIYTPSASSGSRAYSHRPKSPSDSSFVTNPHMYGLESGPANKGPSSMAGSSFVTNPYAVESESALKGPSSIAGSSFVTNPYALESVAGDKKPKHSASSSFVTNPYALNSEAANNGPSFEFFGGNNTSLYYGRWTNRTTNGNEVQSPWYDTANGVETSVDQQPLQPIDQNDNYTDPPLPTQLTSNHTERRSSWDLGPATYRPSSAKGHGLSLSADKVELELAAQALRERTSTEPLRPRASTVATTTNLLSADVHAVFDESGELRVEPTMPLEQARAMVLASEQNLDAGVHVVEYEDPNALVMQHMENRLGKIEPETLQHPQKGEFLDALKTATKPRPSDSGAE